MGDLLWFSGITMQTPVRDIGWTYVLLIAAVVTLAALVRYLWKVW